MDNPMVEATVAHGKPPLATKEREMFARSILAVLRDHELQGCAGDHYCELRDALKAKVAQECPHLNIEAIVQGKVMVFMTDGTTTVYMGDGGVQTFFSPSVKRAMLFDPQDAENWVRSLTDQQRNPIIRYGTVDA